MKGLAQLKKKKEKKGEFYVWKKEGEKLTLNPPNICNWVKGKKG